MFEKITYIAEDGKEFSNKNECIEYEKSNIAFLTESKILFFNESGLQMKLPFNKLMNLTSYIYIPDFSAFRKLEDFNDDYGYDIPNSEGFWYWDNEKSEYVDVYDKKNDIEKQIENLTKEKEKILDLFCKISAETHNLLL